MGGEIGQRAEWNENASLTGGCSTPDRSIAAAKVRRGFEQTLRRHARALAKRLRPGRF